MLADYGLTAFKLGLKKLDMYLIHKTYGDLPSIWKGFEQAQKDGLTAFASSPIRVAALVSSNTFILTGASVSATLPFITSKKS